jgi:hypothetical protein
MCQVTVIQTSLTLEVPEVFIITPVFIVMCQVTVIQTSLTLEVPEVFIITPITINTGVMITTSGTSRVRLVCITVT